MELNGIAALPGAMSLETLIEKHLQKVPSFTALREKYTDASDCKNARDRAILSAVLDAIFLYLNHQETSLEVKIDEEIKEVEIEAAMNAELDRAEKETPFGDLVELRRAYKHDVELLDSGHPAERTLKACAVPQAAITATRKARLNWLAVVDLHTRGEIYGLRDGTTIRTKTDLYQLAAKHGAGTADALKQDFNRLKKAETEFRRAKIRSEQDSLAGQRWNRRFSTEEILYFQQRVDLARKGARKSAGAQSGLDLLLPGVLASQGVFV